MSDGMKSPSELEKSINKLIQKEFKSKAVILITMNLKEHEPSPYLSTNLSTEDVCNILLHTIDCLKTK